MSSGKSFNVPSLILTVKLVFPVACKSDRETDDSSFRLDNTDPLLYHVMLGKPPGIVTTLFLLDSVITILLETSAPLN